MTRISFLHPALSALTLLSFVVFSGCAQRDVARSTTPESQTREIKDLLAKSRSSTRTYESRLGLAVVAANLALKELAAPDGDRPLYNRACAEVALLAQNVTLPANLETPYGTFQLAPASGTPDGIWDSAYCTELIPRDKITHRDYISKDLDEGFGGRLVGVHRSADPRARLEPRTGISFPVTAVVTSKPASTPGATTRVTLALYDPAKREKAFIAGSQRPLAADFTAPLGFYRVPPLIGLLGMIQPGKYLGQEGLFLTEPYDPEKIPLVLIHGLMSDPAMWLPVMAAIEEDAVLRDRYQLWVFAYPTGNPIGYSALDLREALAQMYEIYPDSPDMVIVNHSLGGVITHLQVINSGEALVKGIFKDKAPEIMQLPNTSTVKKGLVFDANPDIDRVVFVAAPHRGAPLATNWIGRIGNLLIRAPRKVLTQIGTTALEAAAAATGEKGKFLPNSINNLSPRSALLVSMNTVPIEVPFHSIIGVAGQPKAPLEETSDSVVPYWSSHLDAALSEKIVPYPHTAMFVKPEATDEIKRILHLHLAETGSSAR